MSTPIVGDIETFIALGFHKISAPARFLLLYYYYIILKPTQRAPSKRKHYKIDISNLDDTTVMHFTRFTYQNLVTIAKALDIPEVFNIKEGHKFTRIEGIFILCSRLAYPSRLETLSLILGWSVTAISGCVSFMIEYIHQNWQYLLRDFDSGHLTPERLKLYAEAVHRKAGPNTLTNCWAFLDCTIRQICRPVEFQREVYNGHKKYHSLKYSALKCPDGIMCHLYGPFSGRRNDNYLLHTSELLVRCMNFAPKFCIYGDSAYGRSQCMQSPWNRITLTEEQFIFNKRMSSCRQCVEWAFEDIIRLWSFLDYHRSQRLFQSRVGLQYRVAAILTNIHICIYGCQTSQYFSLNPPSLETYLKFGPKPSFHDETYSAAHTFAKPIY